MIGLVLGIISCLGVAQWVEKHVSSDSVVGESEWDKESRSWLDRLFNTWNVVALLLLLFFGGAGYFIWSLFQ
ncbi:MAG: hypothetical protein ACFCU3_05420 [Verrucomicrobiales bacterium]